MDHAFLRVFSWIALFALLLACAPAAEPQQAWRLDWRAPIEVAAGGGERGPWRQNDSRFDYVDDATVALGKDGAALVAWADQGRKEVMLQVFTPDGAPRFDAPIDISRSGATFSWLPRIALPPDGDRAVYVLWQEIIFSGGSHGGDILFARSEDGGAGFSQPLNLSHSLGGAGKGRIDKRTWSNGSLDILAGPGGLVIAAWTEYYGALLVSRSTDGGRTFSPPQQVAGTDAQPARGPALARSPDGTILLAWTIGEDARADIRIAASRDGGVRFGEPTVVAVTRGYSDAPKLAVDGHGTVHLVFAESARGPFSDARVVYTRSADGRRFTRPRPISNAARSGSFPSLGLDGDSALYVLWEDARRGEARPRGLALTASFDGGASFRAPMTVPGGADPGGGVGNRQGLLTNKLAVKDGALAVVNSSLRDNIGSRVWLMRGQRR